MEAEQLFGLTLLGLGGGIAVLSIIYAIPSYFFLLQRLLAGCTWKDDWGYILLGHLIWLFCSCAGAFYTVWGILLALSMLMLPFVP